MNNEISIDKWSQMFDDCRHLQLEMELFDSPIEQVKEFFMYAYEGTKNLTNNIFLTEWEYGEKDKLVRITESHIPMLINNIKNGFFSFACEGYSYSNCSTTEKKQKVTSELYPETAGDNLLDIFVSADYQNYISENLNELDSDKNIKSNLLKIFKETNKVYLNKHHGPDMRMEFVALPFHNDKEKFRARLSMSYSVSSLFDDVVSYSEIMAELSIKTAEKIANISARIGIQPESTSSYMSGYMKYFGQNVNDGKSTPDGLWDVEWYPFSYSCGVEWFNIISPLQRKRVPDIINDAIQYDDCEVYELSRGGVVVKSKKDIIHTDIAELMSIKMLMYDALYPGRREYKLNLHDFTSIYDVIKKCMPRSQWELVPIFDDEIEVHDNQIIFSHKNNVRTKGKYCDLDEWW